MVVRAEEPLDDEPADPADPSRDLVGLGQKRALAVRLDQTSVPAKARSRIAGRHLTAAQAYCC
jgi:hypothetical protein